MTPKEINVERLRAQQERMQSVSENMAELIERLSKVHGVLDALGGRLREIARARDAAKP